MQYSKEQMENILSIYSSVEEMEEEYAKRKAEEYLKNTDYIVIKAQEYKMLNKENNEDYSEIFKKREECREILRKIKNV